MRATRPHQVAGCDFCGQSFSFFARRFFLLRQKKEMPYFQKKKILKLKLRINFINQTQIFFSIDADKFTIADNDADFKTVFKGAQLFK